MNRIWDVLNQLFEANPAANPLNAFNYDPTLAPNAPSLLKSLFVINRVIEEDERSGHLPTWPTELGASALLPPKWYQFDYDAEGRVADKSRYSVELTCSPKISPAKT